jgi:hypothetical protein
MLLETVANESVRDNTPAFGIRGYSSFIIAFNIKTIEKFVLTAIHNVRTISGNIFNSLS